MSISWPLSRQQVLDASGRPYLVPHVEFYAGGTTDALTVFKDPTLSTPHAQPVIADGFGRFPRVYLPHGLYREIVYGPANTVLWDDDGIGEAAPTDTVDPATPVSPLSLLSTGDVMWRMDGAIRPGWVRMNERTIGNASSGATELADASAEDLFKYLWQNFVDGAVPVIGGRGLSASADFAAGKQITVPTMRGLGMVGVDDMGSTPAQVIQVIVPITLNAGSTTATVVSSERLAVDMTITAPGVPANTTIVGINGTTITMSQPAGAGSTGTVTARISIFYDAQMAGTVGGRLSERLTADQLPTFTPSGSISPIPPHQHEIDYQRPVSGYGTGGIGGVSELGSEHSPDNTTTTKAAGGVTPTFAGNPIGHGAYHTNVQPSRLGTFYLKL